MTHAALCVSVCFSLVSGMAVSQGELMPSPSLHCALAKGASISNMGTKIVVNFPQESLTRSLSLSQLRVMTLSTTVCGLPMMTGWMCGTVQGRQNLPFTFLLAVSGEPTPQTSSLRSTIPRTPSEVYTVRLCECVELSFLVVNCKNCMYCT